MTEEKYVGGKEANNILVFTENIIFVEKKD